jgi:hypothetical protein
LRSTREEARRPSTNSRTSRRVSAPDGRPECRANLALNDGHQAVAANTRPALSLIARFLCRLNGQQRHKGMGLVAVLQTLRERLSSSVSHVAIGVECGDRHRDLEIGGGTGSSSSARSAAPSSLCLLRREGHCAPSRFTPGSTSSCSTRPSKRVRSKSILERRGHAPEAEVHPREARSLPAGQQGLSARASVASFGTTPSGKGLTGHL